MSKPELRVASAPEGITKLRELIEDGHLPAVYLMVDGLVRVEKSPIPVRDGDVSLPERAVIVEPPLVQRLLAKHVDVQRLNSRNEWGPYVPSVGTIRAAMAGSDWERVPVIRGMVGTPVFRPGWTLLQAPGYDPTTALYLSPTVPMEMVPERPPAQQVANARTFLLDRLLCDFPWTGKVDLANYVGLLLTPFVRVALKAPTSPFSLITASMPGSGKTNLTSILGYLIGQQTVSWPAGPVVDTELEKLITSTFTVSGGAVIFDNLDNGAMISSAALARLLTTPVWSARILGLTAMGAWPNDREWIATGNNLRLGGDLASRSVLVRLEPDCEHPEERTGFKIPNLETWITHAANRSKILRALLILVIDWVNSGAKPDLSIAPMRGWTSLVQGIGGILIHHGVEGYLSNVADVREADEETAKWGMFYTAWWGKFGSNPITAKKLFDSALYVPKGVFAESDPWDGTFITGNNGRPPGTAVQLGQWLVGESRRPRCGYRITGTKDRNKVTWWTLHSIEGVQTVTSSESVVAPASAALFSPRA